MMPICERCGDALGSDPHCPIHSPGGPPVEERAPRIVELLAVETCDRSESIVGTVGPWRFRIDEGGRRRLVVSTKARDFPEALRSLAEALEATEPLRQAGLLGVFNPAGLAAEMEGFEPLPEDHVEGRFRAFLDTNPAEKRAGAAFDLGTKALEETEGVEVTIVPMWDPASGQEYQVGVDLGFEPSEAVLVPVERKIAPHDFKAFAAGHDLEICTICGELPDHRNHHDDGSFAAANPVERYPTGESKIVRASGDAICPECGEPYRKHPHDEEILDYDDRPFLRIACDGTRLKL